MVSIVAHPSKEWTLSVTNGSDLYEFDDVSGYNCYNVGGERRAVYSTDGKEILVETDGGNRVSVFAALGKEKIQSLNVQTGYIYDFDLSDQVLVIVGQSGSVEVYKRTPNMTEIAGERGNLVVEALLE